MKDKKMITIISIVSVIVIVAIIGYMGYNNYKSNNISEEKINSDFTGKEFWVGKLKVITTKDNIKSVNVGKKDVITEFGIRTYNNKGTIVIEEEKYKVEVPFSIIYIYNSKQKEWILGTQELKTTSKDVKLEVKEKLSESIVRRVFMETEFDEIKITEDLVKDIEIESINENDLGTSATVNAFLDKKGAFVSEKIKLQASFILNDEGWEIVDTKTIRGEELIKITQPSEEVTNDELKSDLSILIGKNEVIGIISDKGNNLPINQRKLNIESENIYEIKDLKVSESNQYNTAYEITANVTGTILKSNFEGYMKITVISADIVITEIEFQNITFPNPIEENIKDQLLNFEMGAKKTQSNSWTNHSINEDEMKTFIMDDVLNSENQQLRKYVYGKMNYTFEGVTYESAPVCITVGYSMKSDKYFVDSMRSLLDPGFEAEYSKDVVNR